MVNGLGHMMESNMSSHIMEQVKHITKQNLSDQSKQLAIHTKIIEERKFKTLKICQANNQMDNLNLYDRIKSPFLKKCTFCYT